MYVPLCMSKIVSLSGVILQQMQTQSDLSDVSSADRQSEAITMHRGVSRSELLPISIPSYATALEFMNLKQRNLKRLCKAAALLAVHARQCEAS